MNSDRPSAPDAAEKLRTAIEMFGLGESILREKLRRTYPNAAPSEIEQKILEWLARRPGAEHGDAVGRPRPVPE
jgi:hypothetical protein